MIDHLTRSLQCLGAALWAVFVFALYVLVLMILPALAIKAWAQEYTCGYRTYPCRDTWTGQIVTCERRHCHRFRNHTYYLPEHRAPRVYSYERRRDRDDDVEYAGGVQCKEPMRATGDDKQEQDRAEVSAQDRWSVEVEVRLGTMYSDIRYAGQMRTTCVRKVPNTATEKGQALFGIRHFVCTLTARPCVAPAVRVDEDSRAKRRSERVEEDTRPAPRRDR